MSKYYTSTQQKILQDKRNEKEFPWRERKEDLYKYHEILVGGGDQQRAVRVYSCGSMLVFAVSPGTGEKRLISANFCHDRLCPMCASRRSQKIYNQVSQVMDYVSYREPNLVPVFLTLTVENCQPEDLSDSIGVILKGWRRLSNHKKVRRIIKGSFRSLEITCDSDKFITKKRYNERKEYCDRKGLKPGDLNPNYGTLHPHLHVIFLVDEHYFTGEDYMDTREWVRRWREVAQLDYDPVCDVRRVYTNEKGINKAVAEVSKYAVKPVDYLIKDKDLAQRFVTALNDSLAKRRLVSFTGMMKEAAAQLKLDDATDGDLINTDSGEVKEELEDKVIAVYRWSHEIRNYVLDERVSAEYVWLLENNLMGQPRDGSKKSLG